MSDVIGLAVVGAGYWGPNLVRNAAETPGAELRVICDLDEDRLQKIGARYPGAALTPKFDDVLANDEVQGVILATPAASHHELAKQIGRASCRERV